MNIKSTPVRAGKAPGAATMVAAGLPSFAEPGVVAGCLAPLSAPFEVDAASDLLRYSYAGQRSRLEFEARAEGDGGDDVGFSRDEPLGDAVSSSLLGRAPGALVDECVAFGEDGVTGGVAAGVAEALRAHRARVAAGLACGGDPVVEGWVWDPVERRRSAPSRSALVPLRRRVPLSGADARLFPPVAGSVGGLGLVETGCCLVVDRAGVAWIRGEGWLADVSAPPFEAVRPLVEAAFAAEAAGEVVLDEPVLAGGRRWWRRPFTRQMCDEDGLEREERLLLEAHALAMPVLRGDDPDLLGDAASNVWSQGEKDLWCYPGPGRSPAVVKAFLSAAIGRQVEDAVHSPDMGYKMVDGSWSREWSSPVTHDAMWLGDVLPDPLLRGPEVAAHLGWSLGARASDGGFFERLSSMPPRWRQASSHDGVQRWDGPDLRRVAAAREEDERALASRLADHFASRSGWRVVHVPADYPLSPLVVADYADRGVASACLAVRGGRAGRPRKAYDGDLGPDLRRGGVAVGQDLVVEVDAAAWSARVAALESMGAAFGRGESDARLSSGIGAVAV